VFTDEGIYTVTAENPTTHASTEWTIYVGDNPILKAYAKNSGSYNTSEEPKKIAVSDEMNGWHIRKGLSIIKTLKGEI